MMRVDISTARAAAISRALWGAGLLLAPRAVLRGLGGRRSDLAVVTVRVLGVRHLIQAAVTGWRPGPAVLAVGAGVDALHGLTAVLLAGLDRRQRGPAVAETGLAAAWITAAAAARRHS